MMQILSPSDWGARVNYDNWSDGVVLKDKVIIHYAGGETAASSAFDGVDAEKRLLQSYERYHLDTRGWRGIAYGYAIGMSGTVYRLRGFNQYGAHSGDIDQDGISENKEAIPVLFIMGGSQDASPAMLSAFAQLKRYFEAVKVASIVPILRGGFLPVFGHRDVKSTTCPGDKVYGLIGAEFWKTDLADPEVAATPILGAAEVTLGQAKEWARQQGAHQRFIDIADDYWRLFPILNVRPEVGYAQAQKETAGGNYTGIVQPHMNNWAGIKTRTAAGDRLEDHATFSSPEEGVIAHRDHLRLYALGPVAGTPDPRHFAFIAGRAPTVEALSGNWAPASSYGPTIVDRMDAMKAVDVPEPAPPTVDDEVADFLREANYLLDQAMLTMGITP